MLQEGKTNKEISEEHNIGVNTVKSHVSSILSKLKLKSRREVMKPSTRGSLELHRMDFPKGLES